MIAEGRGERLTSGPAWPALPCVLVNPGVPSPTGPVYKAYDAAARFSDLRAPVLPEGLSVQAAIETLSALRNDLETPAIALQPAIGEALAALTVEPEARLARMSGSGSTCFVLCDDPGAARRLALRLAARRPDWWVRDTRLA